MIEARNVSLIYPPRNGSPRVEALAGLDMTIAEGEFVGIVGPSGCGKSTLLRTVGGLLPLSGGELLINGLDPDAARKSRLFGFDFQDPALVPSRTALRNAQLPGEVMGRPDIIKRAGELIRLVGLDGFQNMLPNQLSGGMQARVALARALSISPQILLLDEPFGSLDALTRERLNLDLLALWQEVGCTVLFVTHSIPEACLLADQVLVMTPRPGRIAKSVIINRPRPRTLEQQFDAGFRALVAEIRAVLTREQS